VIVSDEARGVLEKIECKNREVMLINGLQLASSNVLFQRRDSLGPCEKLRHRKKEKEKGRHADVR
jgi:hypothetical protein